MQARFEPGNYGPIQISPTLQATFSNLNQEHGGRKPHYHEFLMILIQKMKIIYSTSGYQKMVVNFIKNVTEG